MNQTVIDKLVNEIAFSWSYFQIFNVWEVFLQQIILEHIRSAHVIIILIARVGSPVSISSQSGYINAPLCTVV